MTEFACVNRLRTKVVACNESTVFSEMSLDAMSIAALLVTDTGYVRYRNTLAAQCLNAGDGITLKAGRIVPTDPEFSIQFERLLAGTTHARRKSVASHGGAMKLTRKRTSEPLCVTVVPVPNQNRIDHGDTLAIVFISDSLQTPKPRTALMRQLYGLSPVEARVADLLMQGFDIRETTEELNGTLETTRFHVKRILAKTGTHRQAELIRLMSCLPSVQAPVQAK